MRKSFNARFYLGVNNYGTIILDKNYPRHEFKIKIFNDDLVEPFEFFTVNLVSVSPSEYATDMKKVIYIEDNDCEHYF